MSDPRVLHEGHTPTPFTADEIREATPAGYTVETVTEQAGAVVGRQRTVFREVDDVGAVMVSTPIDEGGVEAGEPREGAAAWLDLQGHASFPAAATAVSRESIVTPLGETDCLRYDVSVGAATNSFWFAPAFPGMPIRFTSDATDAPVTTVASITRPP